MIIFTTQTVEKGSDFWFEIKPNDLPVSDFTDISVKYISIAGTELTELTLDEGIEAISTGWIVKLPKETTLTATQSEYNAKITFTMSDGQTIIKTVEKLIIIK